MSRSRAGRCCRGPCAAASARLAADAACAQRAAARPAGARGCVRRRGSGACMIPASAFWASAKAMRRTLRVRRLLAVRASRARKARGGNSLFRLRQRGSAVRMRGLQNDALDIALVTEVSHAMALSTEQKSGVVAQYRRDPKDTGSPEVQIALLSERINGLGGAFQRAQARSLFAPRSGEAGQSASQAAGLPEGDQPSQVPGSRRTPGPSPLMLSRAAHIPPERGLFHHLQQHFPRFEA